MIKEERNSNDVGTAGSESFGPALHGADTEDVGEDETIRDKDGETGHNDIGAHHNENYQITLIESELSLMRSHESTILIDQSILHTLHMVQNLT